MTIIVCNAGSTSLKFKVFTSPTVAVAECRIERIGVEGKSTYSYKGNAEKHQKDVSIPNYYEGIDMFLRCVDNDGISADAVVFKTVLAKGYYGVHELTENVMTAMRQALPIAPVHNKAYIEAIDAFKQRFRSARMLGVFETSFHTTIPLAHRLYAVPYEWYEKYGVERLGYHGASHANITRRIEQLAGKKFRLVNCHLGGSSSICAIKDGQSVDISFGFSPQSGLPQSRRAGDVDPYMLEYLKFSGLSDQDIQSGLSQEGGLIGISGISEDTREIEVAADGGNARAALALDVFVTAIVRYIGSYYAVLGGIDYLVFTGGIGENSKRIRDMVTAKTKHLDIKQICVMAADEESELAHTAYRYFLDNAECGKIAYEWLKKGIKGTVLEVFSRAAYLQIKDKIVFLYATESTPHSIGINIPNYNKLAKSIKKGDEFLCEDGILSIGANRYIINVSTDNKTLLKINMVNKPQYDLVDGLILQSGKADEITTIISGKDFKLLLSGIKSKDDDEICEALQKIIGKGKGLTPSADDAVCGMLYAYHFAKERGFKQNRGLEQLRLALPPLYGRTSKVSAAFLDAAVTHADGFFDGFLESLFSGNNKEIKNYTQKILDIGAGTGAAILTGIILGLKIILVEDIEV